MREKKTVVLANSYSMQLAFNLWRDGVSQEHHLWGASRLPTAEFEVIYADAAIAQYPFERWLRLIGLTRNTRLQLKFAYEYRRCDVFYAATYSVARVLGLLRRLKLFKPRLAALVHYPLHGRWIDRLALGGVDRVLCLSKLAFDDLIRHFPELESRCELLGWAADFDFYDEAARKNSVSSDERSGPLRIVAAGKDSRDYASFVQGVETVSGDLCVEVYCSSDKVPESVDQRISVVVGGDRSNPLSINALVDIYIASDVIAIPLLPVHRVAGLTSLIDALALGKPVLCTRNAGLDIDIEAIGCGLWVEPGSPESWSRALESLNVDRSQLKEMGIRGRRYAEEMLRMDDYGARLTDAVRAAIGEPSAATISAIGQ